MKEVKIILVDDGRNFDCRSETEISYNANFTRLTAAINEILDDLDDDQVYINFKNPSEKCYPFFICKNKKAEEAKACEIFIDYIYFWVELYGDLEKFYITVIKYFPELIDQVVEDIIEEGYDDPADYDVNIEKLKQQYLKE